MKKSKKSVKSKESLNDIELIKENQEIDQTLTGWDVIKENISPFLQVSAVLSALFTGMVCIIIVFMNYVKSFLYSIDYSLFKIDFNLYNVLLIYIVLIGCAFCVMALWNTFCVLKNKILKKEIGKMSKISIAISLILLVICIRCYKYGVIVLLSFIATVFGLGIIVLGMFQLARVSSKHEKEKRDEPFYQQLIDIGYKMTLMILIEFILVFGSTYFGIALKNDYYVLKNNDDYEVVIETYEDYYITKKANIVDDKLYIIRDSQNVRSTKDTEINKRVFQSISFR